MTNNPLSPETTFLIDFNLHQVPATLGIDVPAAAAAKMMGITEAQFLAYAAQAAAEVDGAAKTLLAHSEFARAIDQIAVPVGGTMMTIGDSVTTYRHSYARLLESMVALRRPDDNIRFLNVAQSGYTSTHGLENVYTQFLPLRPDWVSIKFGVNDCKIFGELRARTLVSIEEYRANMVAIVQAFLKHSSARPVLFTPVPVVEDVVNSNPDFQLMRMTWNNDDIRARAGAVREIAQKQGLPLIDLVGLFGDSPDPTLYLDGLHPGPAGHQLILETVLRTLSSQNSTR